MSEYISSDDEVESASDESSEIATSPERQVFDGRRDSVLHSIKWSRVILDEAHRIKERNNSTAASTFSLDSEFRWCITGTPMQNKVSDLHALLRFLRVSPFAYYHCKAKDCNCQSLDYSFVDNKYCINCQHGKA